MPMDPRDTTPEKVAEARSWALELWMEEAIFAMVEHTPDPQATIEKIAGRVETAAAEVRKGRLEMAFLGPFDERVNEIRRNLTGRLLMNRRPRPPARR